MADLQQKGWKTINLPQDPTNAENKIVDTTGTTRSINRPTEGDKIWDTTVATITAQL